MPIESITCDTPRYVLLEVKEPIGPDVVQDSSNSKCVAIYGFSDKQAYDVFNSNIDRELRPYPLMNGYLRNRIAETTDETHLVVIDALSPTDERLIVVTMESVLAAESGGAARLENGFNILLCQGRTEYALSGVAD